MHDRTQAVVLAAIMVFVLGWSRSVEADRQTSGLKGGVPRENILEALKVVHVYPRLSVLGDD